MEENKKTHRFKKVTRVEINRFIQNKLKEILTKISKKEIEGSSPPEIFVGQFGYPKVYIGPLLPPIKGNTEIFGKTEEWWGKKFEEIIKMRVQMVRGKKQLKVTDTENYFSNKIKEIILSKKSVDTEMKIKKTPYGFNFSNYHKPFGPSTFIKWFDIRPGRTDFKIEKVFYDTDLNSKEAIINLYNKGVEISKIQQVLSAGMIGIQKSRKFVPTRWSITAVDDSIGKYLIEKIKQFTQVEKYLVYTSEYLDNRWAVLMIPAEWSYESIEVWYPGTVSEKFSIGHDWEGFDGEKGYASIGGSYYAGRLAVCEKLVKDKRQASVVVFREIHSGYSVPVGVWNVRETLRNTLKSKPNEFETIEDALNYISSKLTVPMDVWFKNSIILRKNKYQKNLLHFFNK